ncbi:MAG: hypothetical protein WCS17_03455 [Prevotella sp.]
MDGNEWMREDVQIMCKGCMRFGQCPFSIVMDALANEECSFREETITITDM